MRPIPPLPPAQNRAPTKGALRRSIERARAVLWRGQELTGAWQSAADMGPLCTAQVVTGLHFAGHLGETEAREAAAWLEAQQLADGSFLPYPSAREGALGVTAVAWAALVACGRPAEDPAVARARTFVASRGGLEAVRERFAAGDPAALFLAMAGVIPAAQLPRRPMRWILVRPLVRFLERRFHAGALLLLLQIGAIARSLRGEYGEQGTGARPRAERRLLQLLEIWQNADGSVNGNSLQTVLALATYHALGLRGGDHRVAGAVASLQRARRRDRHGSWSIAFEADVWTTALNLRALLASGVMPSDPRALRAIEFLLAAQSRRPQPRVNQRRPKAVRTGGWAFQRHNTSMVDCDDTGMVLGVLGQAAAVRGPGQLSPGIAARVRVSVERGRAWLEDMQNPDGGWSAFVHDMPARQRGAMLQRAFEPPRGWLGRLRLLLRPPAEFGDPSTEDVTARALYGLARTGSRAEDARIHRALAFLRYHQTDAGAFFGRWVVNYLPATAHVVAAAAALGLDRHGDWIRRAIDWMRTRQNPDGGFGESVESYRDPSQAGRGPSTPALTGLVLSALVDAGEGATEAADRAAAYLLRAQREDGTWSNEDYLAPFIPPESFYVYPGTAAHAPLEALARYAEEQHPCAVPPRACRWSAELLDRMQTRPADPLAARAARTLLRRPGSFSVLGQLDRLPTHAPEELRVLLDATSRLPDFADPARLRLAADLFRRESFRIGNALFFAALPCSYASATGARVLVSSAGLARRSRKRILATAQFVLDVLQRDALRDGGPGLRACQRVRLAHAMAREKCKQSLPDAQPIHQEHMAAMIHALTIPVIDALTRLGVRVTREEADAWLHLWNVVGHLLGVSPEMRPVDVADARAFGEHIRSRQWQRSPAGEELTGQLLTAVRAYLPWRRLHGLPTSMIRILCGDHLADLLALPPADRTRGWIERSAYLRALRGSASEWWPRLLHGATVWVMRCQARWMLAHDIARGILLACRRPRSPAGYGRHVSRS